MNLISLATIFFIFLCKYLFLAPEITATMQRKLLYKVANGNNYHEVLFAGRVEEPPSLLLVVNQQTDSTLPQICRLVQLR